MAFLQVFVFFLVTLSAAFACESFPTFPRDCEDVQKLGFTETGIYTIFPERTSGMRVRCDMDTAGGGWTVIQRRVSDTDFYKTWDAYQIGFGDLNASFWLGNLQISRLTSQNWYQLRVDMTHANGTSAYAGYRVFAVGDTESKYRLLVNGYHGNAGDAMVGHNGFQFSTRDQDNDIYGPSCAEKFSGAWWYTKCHSSNLNGDYGNTAYAKGLTWHPFTGYFDHGGDESEALVPGLITHLYLMSTKKTLRQTEQNQIRGLLQEPSDQVGNVGGVSNNLVPDEMPSYSASHPTPSCLHRALGPTISRQRVNL